jgi:hypothetical protein
VSEREEETSTEAENEGQEGAPGGCLEAQWCDPEERRNIRIFAGQFEIVGDIESPIEDWKYSDPAKELEK